MVKRKILVIDDDLFWHKLLKRLFADEDYDLHTAESCKAGIRMAELHRPDCILLDFHLGDGDALDVCTALKKGEAKPQYPVIIVSSDPGAEIAAYAECHADYFVLKGSRSMMELPGIVLKVIGNTDAAVSLEPGQ